MEERLTEALLEELLSAPRVEDYLRRHALDTPTLAEYLNQLLDESGLTRAEVLRRANMEQTLGWYAFKGQRGLGRDNALKLAFAFGLDVRRANRLLQAAGAKALYAKNRRDAILIHCLQHACTLQQTNYTLHEFGEECL
jgi:hypothetical protein